ncbi:NAD(P)/FAD-dependent oxidoreductase [bacterium]|nr:NAD(P)/FAD-dependent oxidoreductase [bacterium]
MTKKDIIVVGAGAGGLMAAGRAAELGADVLLIEHMSAVGRKLAITGKGRCNLTNVAEQAEFLKHFYPNGRFLRTAFSGFFSDHIINFFEAKGVKTVIERGGRVFPQSGNAGDVVNALEQWVKKSGVTIRLNTAVEQVITEQDTVKGVLISAVERRKNKLVKIGKQEEIQCNSLILVTGGASYPATGSTGEGYRIAKKLGHTVITPRPALVPLETAGRRTEALDGLQLKNVTASTWVNGKRSALEFGEMSFTPFGVTGPIILTLSHEVVDQLSNGNQVELQIDLKPALDHKTLDDRLIREFQQSGKKQFKSILKNLLPRQLIQFCLEDLNIEPDITGNEIQAGERKRIRNWLKAVPFSISGYRPFSEAIITSGGVSVKEVNPKTMESRLVRQLFFAGEVLDIQADTGGYNLQAAFSTGWLAAESAVKSLSTD